MINADRKTTLVATTRPKRKLLSDSDSTPVTPVVELIDCEWEDGTPVTGQWDVIENDGVNVTLWSMQQGKIMAPLSKCKFITAYVGRVIP